MADILEQLAERRNKLGATESSTYVNQQELNSIGFMEQAIENGRTAERDAASYIEFMKTNAWDWRAFHDFKNAREKNSNV